MEDEAILKFEHFMGFLGTFLLVLCVLASTGFAENMTIRVGVPLPLSGPKAGFGEMHHKSYVLALEDINASGGIRGGKYAGYKLAFLFEDTLGKAESARKLTEKLISHEHVPIIMGGYSSAAASAIAKVCEQNKIPFISPSGAADKITQQRWKYTFRINPPASEYTTGLQAFFLSVVKPEYMVILFENTNFGVPTAHAMKRWGEENRIQVLMFEPYEPWAEDFRGVLTTVKAINPDVVFVAGRLADAILLVQQMNELDLRPRLLAGSAGTFAMPPFIQEAGAWAENIVSSSLWIPNVKYRGAKSYAGRYREKYGAEPDYHGAEAYAAAWVCKDVLERSKSLEANDLVKALRATGMMTVFGPVKFISYENYRNQNKLPTLVVQIQNGKPVTIWPPEASTAGFVNPSPLSVRP